MAGRTPTSRSLEALRALGYAPWVEIPLTKGLVAKLHHGEFARGNFL